MYQMYPDWGPARNNPEHPHNRDAIQQMMQDALDQRDSDGLLPDDN